jgi:hypothetical protein
VIALLLSLDSFFFSSLLTTPPTTCTDPLSAANPAADANKKRLWSTFELEYDDRDKPTTDAVMHLINANDVMANHCPEGYTFWTFFKPNGEWGYYPLDPVTPLHDLEPNEEVRSSSEDESHDRVLRGFASVLDTIPFADLFDTNRDGTTYDDPLKDETFFLKLVPKAKDRGTGAPAECYFDHYRPVTVLAPSLNEQCVGDRVYVEHGGTIKDAVDAVVQIKSGCDFENDVDIALVTSCTRFAGLSPLPEGDQFCYDYTVKMPTKLAELNKGPLTLSVQMAPSSLAGGWDNPASCRALGIGAAPAEIPGPCRNPNRFKISDPGATNPNGDDRVRCEDLHHTTDSTGLFVNPDTNHLQCYGAPRCTDGCSDYFINTCKAGMANTYDFCRNELDSGERSESATDSTSPVGCLIPYCVDTAAMEATQTPSCTAECSDRFINMCLPANDYSYNTCRNALDDAKLFESVTDSISQVGCLIPYCVDTAAMEATQTNSSTVSTTDTTSTTTVSSTTTNGEGTAVKPGSGSGTVRTFRRTFTLEDAIGPRPARFKRACV